MANKHTYETLAEMAQEVEQNNRDQVKDYLESTNQSPKGLCDRIKALTDSKISAPTIYNWYNGSKLGDDKLSLIICIMRLDGYEFNI